MPQYTSQTLSGSSSSIGGQVKHQVETHGTQGWRLHSLVSLLPYDNQNHVMLVWEKPS
jgi:hypothetical protein